MSKILQKLKGEDLQSTGKSEGVVHDILESTALFGEVFEGKLMIRELECRVLY